MHAAVSALHARPLPPPPPPVGRRGSRRQPQRRCSASPAGNEGTPAGPPGSQTPQLSAEQLRQRAEQLAAARRRLDEEAALLAAQLGAAAAQGELAPADRQALLAALELGSDGGQQAQERQGAAAQEAEPSATQQQQAQQPPQPDRQQAAQLAAQAAAEQRRQAKREKRRRKKALAEAAAAEGEAPEAGSPEWRAGLPPELRRVLEESGLDAALDEQAAAVAREREWGRSERYQGGDMEAVARIIEEGGELPPLPEEMWERSEPEDAGEFLARLQGSIDYTNTDLKGVKHRGAAKRGTGEAPTAGAAGEGGAGQAAAGQPVDAGTAAGAAAGEGTAAQRDAGGGQAREAALVAALAHTSELHVAEAAAEYSSEPRLAAAYARGWEQGKAADRMVSSKDFWRSPLTEEVTKSVPVPHAPPDAMRIYKAAERIAYVLRRAHLDSDSPAAPLLALRSKGLISEDFVLQDPFVVRDSLEGALEYLQRVEQAGAQIDVWTFMLRCPKYTPLPQFQVTIDCFINVPYPGWFYSWVLLNPSASSPEARITAAAAAPDSHYAPVSAAAVAGRLARDEAGERAELARNEELIMGMVRGATQAAADAGFGPLDAAGTAAAMLAAARMAVKRQQAAEEARQDAQQEAVAAGKEARRRAEERSPEEVAAAWEAAAAGQLPVPELREVHREPYGHGGQQRDHTWVLLDVEEQHRQLGRQVFSVYPRYPSSIAGELVAVPAAGEAAADGQAAAGTAGRAAGGAAAGKEEAADEVVLDWRAPRGVQVEWEVEEMSEAEVAAEQERQYQLLPREHLLERYWGLDDWLATMAQQEEEQQEDGRQQQGQDVQQGSAAEGQQQPGGGGGDGRRKKWKQRRGAATREGEAADGAEVGSAAAGEGGIEEEQKEEEEELFPFTFDWERQRRRREAGAMFRSLLGPNFEKAMAQMPQLGRSRGRASNGALQQRAEQEGTAWLDGECMTVQATFTYSIDAETLQVDTCGIVWGAMHGLHLHEVTDAWDIWLESTGTLHEAECMQDAASAWGQQQEAEAEGGAADKAAAKEAQQREGEALAGWRSWVPFWRS